MARSREPKPRLVKIWPTAGQRLGYRSASATYAAAAKGHIPTVTLGRLKKVPEGWLDRVTSEGDAEHVPPEPEAA